MNQQNKKGTKSNFTFIIFTVIFFVGMSIVFQLQANNAIPKWQLLSGNTIYNVNEDLSVSYSANILVKAENEKSFQSLLEGYKKSDLEQKDEFADFLNSQLAKGTKRTFEVLSFDSNVNSSDLNISVVQTVVVKGFVESINENKIKFYLDGKSMNIDANSEVRVVAPEGWKIEEVYPAPTVKEDSYVLWKNVGQIDFPDVTMKRIF